MNEPCTNLAATITWFDYCPGDMTKYRVIATQLPTGVFQGADERQWIVSFPDLGSSYYIREGASLHPCYIAEKFRGRVLREVNEHTALMMAQAIARVVPGAKVIE